MAMWSPPASRLSICRSPLAPPRDDEPKHHVECEAADDGADEAAVTVLADQHVHLVARVAALG